MVLLSNKPFLDNIAIQQYPILSIQMTIKHKHIALYGSTFSTQSKFFKNMMKGQGHEAFAELQGKKGALFSNMTLEKFMEEELAHDAYDLTATMGRSIRTLSSGEQKKALLQHLLRSKPDFLVLDNPFDALDVNSVAHLKEELIQLSKELLIIQLFKRKSDLLPFINYGLYVENDEVIFEGMVTDYLKNIEQKEFSLLGDIPPPLEEIEVDNDELIRLKNVTVSYEERPILNNINWTINTNEFWQLIGPNGSGKSTLLTMIDGDNPKAFGQEIYLFGKLKGSGETVWDIKKKLGYFTPSMMELFKARRHKAEGMIIGGLHDSIGLYHTPSDAQRHLAVKWLKVIGLENKSNVAFVDLSQVEQRMVLIARAMIKHPPVLILDEPSNGLDDYSATMLVTLINKIAKESKSSILYVSHRSEEGLQPDKILELTPSKSGSTGHIS